MVRSFCYLKVALLGKADKLVNTSVRPVRPPSPPNILGRIGKPKTSRSGGTVVYSTSNTFYIILFIILNCWECTEKSSLYLQWFWYLFFLKKSFFSTNLNALWSWLQSCGLGLVCVFLCKDCLGFFIKFMKHMCLCVFWLRKM